MFYILTCGSTASVWLATALSRHPEIVCFHGAKSLLAQEDPSLPPPSAQNFVAELIRLYHATQRTTVFGAIHGFPAHEIVPELVAIDGAFVAMTRHPITRLNSLFHREVDFIGAIDLAKDDVYRPFRVDSEHLETAAVRAQLERLSSSEPLSVPGRYMRRFHELCSSVTTEDTFILSKMLDADIFRYEKIIRDRDYFRACFDRIATGARRGMAFCGLADRVSPPTLECTSQYLDDVFSIPRSNRKNTGEEEAEAIYAAWPRLFQQCLISHLDRQGGKHAVERYAAFDYPLPAGVLEAFGVPVAPSSVCQKPTRPPASAPILSTPQMAPPRIEVHSRVRQVLAAIRAERTMNAAFLKNERELVERERGAFVARIEELLHQLENGQAAHAHTVTTMLAQLESERAASVIRITELLAQLENWQAAHTRTVTEILAQRENERAASVLRINELLTQIENERAAYAAHIAELVRQSVSERTTLQTQISALTGRFDAESLKSTTAAERLVAVRASPIWLIFSAWVRGRAAAKAKAGRLFSRPRTKPPIDA